MGIFEPSVLTLFNGWCRLITFLAGATQLLLAIESWIDEKGPYRNNALLHIMSIIGGLWFTCEMIWVPQYVFGGVSENNSLVDILRIPWEIAMSVFVLMMVGVKHTSDLLDNEVIKYSRLTLVSLAVIISLTYSIAVRPERKLWEYGKNWHGYMTKRWYEAKIERQQTFAGVNLNLLLGLPLLVCPSIAILAEAGKIKDAEEDDLIVIIAAISLSILLLIDASFFMISPTLQPIHQAVLWVHLYVASRAAEEYGNWVMFAVIAPAVPWIFIELWGSKGQVFFDYAEFVGHNTVRKPYRTMYRFFYVVAVWCGVFGIVCWIVGWYGEWISFEIENGSVVQSVVDFFKNIEEQITQFLTNIYRIVNKLSVCSSLGLDPTLETPGLLDGGDQESIGILGAVTIGTLNVAVGSTGESYVQFQDNDKGAQCCACDLADSFSSIDHNTCSKPGTTTPATSCDASDDFLEQVLLLNASLTSVDDILSKGFDTCKEVAVTKSEIEDTSWNDGSTDATELQQELDDWNAQQAVIDKIPEEFQGGLTAPTTTCTGGCASDVEAWEDPGDAQIQSASTCAKVQCGLLIALIAGGTAASFIPFVGGAISTTVKTAGRIVFQLFKQVRKLARGFTRSNFRRKLFRKARIALNTAIDATTYAKKQIIKTTEDLIYAFVPLFALGFVSIFAGFWRREESKEARPSLKGAMAGLLFANLVGAGLATFIPYIAKVVAEALPEEIIIVTVTEEIGWLWIKYGTWFSLSSCVFWGMALLLDNEFEDDASKESAAITPVDKLPDLEDSDATAKKLRIAKIFRKPENPKPKRIGNNPFIKDFDNYFDNTDWTAKEQAEWINNILWLIPVIVLVSIAFYNETPIFRVYTSMRPETWGNITQMSKEEGLQESFSSLNDDDRSGTFCSIVGTAVKGLLYGAARVVGQPLLEAFDILGDWFKQGFYQFRLMIKKLLSLPELPIDFLIDNTSLIIAFGCPITACFISVIGVLVSVLPVTPILKVVVDIDFLHQVQYLLGVGGLSLALTMYGISGVIATVPIPMFLIDIKTTNVLLNAVICNILVLVSYLSYLFNSRVPLYPTPKDN